MQKKGFTLIELLVVIAIIGLISSLSIIAFTTSRQKARLAGSLSFSRSVLNLVGDDAISVMNFDECSGLATFDTSGQRHDGTLIGGPTWSTDTVTSKGCSLKFDGVDDYIEINYSWSVQHNNFTASVWFKTTFNGEQVLVTSGNEDIIEMMSGRLRSNTIYSSANGTQRVNDNTWHFAVITGDNTSIRLYLDAKSTPEITLPADTTLYDGDLLIGRCQSGYNFHGLIDDIRVYQRTYTAQEIQTLYTEGRSRNLANK